MITFCNIIEEWAKIYKPIAHDPANKHKAFFKIDSEENENAFFAHFNTIQYNCMGYDTRIHASVVDRNPKMIAYAQYVLFMVHQKTSTLRDEEESMRCKSELNEMCIELVSYLAKLKSAAPEGKLKISDDVTVDISTEDAITLQGLDFSEARWETEPKRLGAWWMATLELTVLSPRRKCLTEAKYGK